MTTETKKCEHAWQEVNSSGNVCTKCGEYKHEEKYLTGEDILDRLQEIYVTRGGPTKVMTLIHFGFSCDNVPNDVRKALRYGLWLEDNPKAKEKILDHDPATGRLDLTDVEED